ncbi:filamentous haemagglutinin family protein [Janthinobacterium fluminis]|uniref:Filamentous hemagglutinin family protein n=1 Tax=Janthinobacterium fluminis TaxID=2987524 RepID=A0ABT5JY49_9BURK|nr:filamentous haemagglutinin family protein [Janthinobacterium fluminis]MDC8757657.1 filamentous hemagglutinin family protein [Janthinobacterium fluminis]
MNTCGRSGKQRSSIQALDGPFRLAPLAQAVALMLVAGGAMVDVRAQQAFSGAWFAAKGAVQNAAGASGRLPGGQPLPGQAGPLAQQQKAGEQLQRSLNNLNLAARGIAAQQAAQAAARLAATGGPAVPDGLADGGLKVDTNALTAGWINAGAPVQSVAGGKTTVSIGQTADKAILNWESFNVGRDTTVAFVQQKDWALLNKVNDPSARPSQIQGQIKADGTVMLVNRNGVVFHGSSQVNTRNLLVSTAAIGDAQFRDKGLYVDTAGSQPTFSDALGKVEVQAGAQIATAAPKSVTEGGGYVLLMGAEVHNAGAIQTPNGQTVLAAGDSFSIRRGVGSGGNLTSTTRGNEVLANAGGAAGAVANTGLIQAATGDVTLAGRDVVQDGVVLSSTSVNTRGTVHLNGAASVTLGQRARTAILLDGADATALDSQRAGLQTPLNAGAGDIEAAGADRRDQSRIDVASGGTVDFQGGSLTLATGGQLAVSAARRSLLRDGAVVDVSGAVGVKLAMDGNSVKVNIQGNEQRDSPLNRDSKNLNSSDAWVDVRDLVYVPAGTNGYASDRWYTAGGLLEVGGYLGTAGHRIGEWMALGGTVGFAGGDLVTQRGSLINLSGGTLDVQSGAVRQSWLKGADGRLHEVSKASGDLPYTGLYKGYEEVHARWGDKASAHYANPLIAPQSRLENGYTVGRDAGTLLVSTKNAVLEGEVASATFQGERQTQAAQAGLDGYKQSQKAVARGGQLVVGSYTPYFLKNSGVLQHALGADAGTLKHVVLGAGQERVAAGLDLDTALPAERQGRLFLDTEQLNGFQLGAIKIAASGKIEVNARLQTAAGGNITLYGQQVAVEADLTARAGSIELGNVLRQIGSGGVVDLPVNRSAPAGSVSVAGGVALDASGLWSAPGLNQDDGAALPYLNGGRVSLRSGGSVRLAEGSLVDVASGGALLANGKRQGGRGGDVNLHAQAQGGAGTAALVFEGALRGYGVNGGGTLSLQAGKVLIGAAAGAAEADTLALARDFFSKGFSAYEVAGTRGLSVAEGAVVDVDMPVYRFDAGARPSAAPALWTPSLYQDDALKGVLTQRRGASLSLQAGSRLSVPADIATVQASIGKGAVINVDAGQSIEVRSIGQLNVDGTLNAWGGKIKLATLPLLAGTQGVWQPASLGRSILVGEHARLDVAARGQRYGQVRDGGSIVVGGEIDRATGKTTASELFIVVREGAVLDASGAQATLDLPGQGGRVVASNGGSIALASGSGFYLDGALRADAGGKGAAGGTLAVALDALIYDSGAPQQVRRARELVLGQRRGAAADAAASLAYGQARLGADQVKAGGFDNLSLLSKGALSVDGDLALSLGQSLNLYAGAYALADGAAAGSRATLAAPSVRLAGVAVDKLEDGQFSSAVRGGVSRQAPAGLLRVEAANVLDLRDEVGFGTQGAIPALGGGQQQLDRRAFERVELLSQGDIRFLAAAGKGVNTLVSTPADLHLAAAQLYPATGAVATVQAGYVGGNLDYDPARTLSIGRSGAAEPAAPYSAFGNLTLGAAVIEQGGVLRAPLGAIALGTESGGVRTTKALRLLPGSVSSVSGAGLALPYGGTIDGVSWQYDGAQVELLGVGGTGQGNNLRQGLSLISRAVDVRDGAVLDLSGGGALLGAAFVSGRGGSIDARYHPLVQNGANGGFTTPGLASNPVYAIVPGVQVGVAPAGGASEALAGQQVSIGAGVPGLAAGTYTLLPSTYALLPGAFRVEINGKAGAAAAGPAAVMRNGSWSTSGQLSVARTDIADALPSRLIVTPAAVLRSYAQYNETGYADFVRADAARRGVPRAALEADAKTLALRLLPGNAAPLDFEYAGKTRFQAGAGGFGGTFAVIGSSNMAIEVLAGGARASALPNTVSLRANDLNAVGASRLAVGARPWVSYGQGGNYVRFGDYVEAAGTVSLRQGATLSAPEVFLVSGGAAGAIEVEQGAAINTLGRGKAAYDSADGFVYQPSYRSVLAVSNARLQMLAPETDGSSAPGRILVGQCAPPACAGDTALYSEGTIAFATNNAFELRDAVRYGTRHLALAVGGINVGGAEALAAAAARQALPAGLTLNQRIMDRLLRGDTGAGAPALESLSLTAAGSLNFYGDTSLSTLDASGKSVLERLVLTTPAIYGHGGGADVARIQTGTLVWNGAAAAPAGVVAGGAGTGGGSLAIQAQRIEFGYGPYTQPDGVADAARLTLGFASVDLSASERITANHKGSLAVYQRQDGYEAGKGFQYSGGQLNISAPLLTGAAGSVNRIGAGGAIRVTGAPGGAAAPAGAAGEALGAELALSGASIAVDSAVVLPSGKLTLSAKGDLSLGAAARIDVSGRKLTFNDVAKYSWGGEVNLDSRAGNIRQAGGAVIDLSAQHNQGGSLKVVALDAAAGQVALDGSILGAGSGQYDAGGTLLSYKAGAVDIRAQGVGDFAALNRRLNEGGVFGARSFQLKQGDLRIGDELRAGAVNVSLDNGSLTVAGTIAAGGERVGSIRLAGKHGLTIAATGVLDAHGTVLRVDSYGKIIDAPNRAVVELDSGTGQLTLAGGARIDLRHGTAAQPGKGPGRHDGQARGTLELNAPRLDAADPGAGDIAIDAAGSLAIQGARAIAVNGVARYTDAAPGAAPAAGGRPYQFIDKDYLDRKHAESGRFINNALDNAGLMKGKLAGLNNAAYADVFHLRPGVAIVTEGDLVVSGDLDLSGYRYAGVNPHAQPGAARGSGEVGSLTLRAGGNLSVYGSINDGFAPPPPTPDDAGWVLTPGRQAFGADVVVPGAGVVLAGGSLFPSGKTLNYALPIQAATLLRGTVLPVQGALAAPLELPANTVLRAAVRDGAGKVVYAAGTLIERAVTLPEGTLLDAGTLLPNPAALAALRWPAGVPLPSLGGAAAAEGGVLLAGDLPLEVGALIPSQTEVRLPGGALSVPLRHLNGARQGSNWAVAAMLPEGSQSWSLRLVSGADTQAADPRALKPALYGDLTLADNHYALYKTYQKIIGPSTPDQWVGAWYWSEGATGPGRVPGTPVPAGEQANCPDACTSVNYVWGPVGADLGFEVGKPVTAEWEGFCGDEGVCILVGQFIPGKPGVETDGPLRQVSPISQHFSVLRTGTGDLDLIAAGNIAMQSPFGLYTAGTSTASLGGAAFDRPRGLAGDGKTVLGAGGKDYEGLVDEAPGSQYAAWYPDHGGNVLVRAGASLTGDILSPALLAAPENGRIQRAGANLGNWLWRQGTGATAGVTPQPTSWWINFGTYIKEAGGANIYYQDKEKIDQLPMLVGFTGIATLGGGNLSVEVGGDAGMLSRRGDPAVGAAPRSQGLVLAVAGSGRVTPDGQLLLTGGGDLDVRVGGALNPGLEARAINYHRTGEGGAAAYGVQNLNLNGVLANLRGALQLQTGSLGGVALNYGARALSNDLKEERAYDPFKSTLGTASGGMTLMLGDAAARLNTRGDLVLAGAGDPGRVPTENTQGFSYGGKNYGDGANGWFSLWTERTAIDLLAAGGSLAPSVQAGALGTGGSATPQAGDNYSPTDGRFLLPSQLRAVAANGSIFLGRSALGQNGPYNTAYSLLTAPSANASLELLAGDSIYASGYAVSQSGADPAALPTPFKPAFIGVDRTKGDRPIIVSNLSGDGVAPGGLRFPLFAFGPDSASGAAAGTAGPARFYAAQGDIVGLRSGEVLHFSGGHRIGQRWYEGAGPVWMTAGRDIVNSGTPLDQPTSLPSVLGYALNGVDGGGASSGNLFVHRRAGDVSLVSAGRDILFSSFQVAGPGTLELTAGRNIRMDDRAAVSSIGAVVAGDGRPGADIVMQAGVGAAGPAYAAFAARYLDPLNRLQDGLPLAGQAGKVAKTYEAELAAWLGQRYAFAAATPAAAAGFFGALPAEQQRIFLRQVYFAELKAGGREYNEAGGVRFGSYLRGRNAIAALFPAGAAAAPGGDITMYGSAGVNTLFGGAIQMLTPGGQQVFGAEGEAPKAVAGVIPGVITQGAGNVELYARDSILLGQSRVMTTFGGHILGWSGQGDINAGRGAKSGVVYTPPKRVYDNWGNVALSSAVPSTGAGIATLAPIPEVPAGDIDLIAPLGTIDAGEAGIRVSGNVNLAAQQVLNAANIQVKGQSAGIPLAAVVNVAALSNASAAASQATAAAQEATQRERAGARAALPSIFSVRVLGFGEEPAEGAKAPSAALAPPSGGLPYDRKGVLQFVGVGQDFAPAQVARLSEEQRRQLAQDQ